jgi:hypothetical protein
VNFSSGRGGLARGMVLVPMIELEERLGSEEGLAGGGEFDGGRWA